MRETVLISPLLESMIVCGNCCKGTSLDHFHVYVDGVHVHSVSAKY